MYCYEFIGFRKNKGEIFYIDGVNISDKTWFNTGKCVTGKGNNSGGVQYSSIWDINIEDNNYDSYAALWNSSRTYSVNIFEYSTGNMLTIPIGSRPLS